MKLPPEGKLVYPKIPKTIFKEVGQVILDTLYEHLKGKDMKFFNELTPEQQNKALDKIESAPLFHIFRMDVRTVLANRKYCFDENLNLHVLPCTPEEKN